MTPEQKEVLLPYLRAVADRMGLRDWTLQVTPGPPSTPREGVNTMATVEKWFGRRIAEFSFRDDITGESPESVRHIIVHEMTHLPFEPIGHYLDRTVRDLIGVHAYDPFVEAHRLLHEEAIDHLAEVIAAFMPEFPGWPDAG